MTEEKHIERIVANPEIMFGKLDNFLIFMAYPEKRIVLYVDYIRLSG